MDWQLLKKYSAFIPIAILSPRFLLAPTESKMVAIASFTCLWCLCFRAPDYAVKFIGLGMRLSEAAVSTLSKLSAINMYVLCGVLAFLMEFAEGIFMIPLIAFAWNVGLLIIVGMCFKLLWPKK
ncbi:MAG: hypothetical protein LBL52_02495 [Rickettsiales bacterium]|jgi:hypothetical protein|nr:hypothetical protein [Rickettsiales bacterium]